MEQGKFTWSVIIWRYECIKLEEHLEDCDYIKINKKILKKEYKKVFWSFIRLYDMTF